MIIAVSGWCRVCGAMMRRVRERKMREARV